MLATVSNLYPYGRVDGPITTDLAFDDPGPKARVRAAMWRDALAAHKEGRVRVTEVRGSDYLTVGANSHLGDLVTGRLVAGRSALFLVPVDNPHTFTYVPDVATTLVAAAETEAAWGQAWHVPSAPARTPREAVGDLCAAAGVQPVPVRVLPHAVVRAAGLAVPMMREMAEMRHSWEAPYVLEDSRTIAELAVKATPWETSTATVVEGYRSRGDRAARAA